MLQLHLRFLAQRDFALEPGQQALALDGMKKCAPQKTAVESPLDQIVLGAGGHRPPAGIFVIQAGQHHDRDAAAGLDHAAEGFLRGWAVRQFEIEQQGIEALCAKRGERARQAIDMRPFHTASGIGKHVPHPLRVGGITLDQQQLHDFPRFFLVFC